MVTIIGLVAGLWLTGAVVRAVGPEPPLTVEEQARIVRARMRSSDYKACGEY